MNITADTSNRYALPVPSKPLLNYDVFKKATKGGRLSGGRANFLSGGKMGDVVITDKEYKRRNMLDEINYHMQGGSYRDITADITVKTDPDGYKHYYVMDNGERIELEGNERPDYYDDVNKPLSDYAMKQIKKVQGGTLKPWSISTAPITRPISLFKHPQDIFSNRDRILRLNKQIIRERKNEPYKVF